MVLRKFRNKLKMEVLNSKESLIINNVKAKRQNSNKTFNPDVNDKINEINYVDNESKKVIEYSWRIRFDSKFKMKSRPFTKPRLKHIITFLPASIRCYKHLKQCRAKNREAYIDFFKPLRAKKIYGAPIGGIGAGTIGRTFTGEFARFQLVPGIYEHEIVEANLFTVNIRKNSSTTYQQALTVSKKFKSSGLKSWNIGYSSEFAKYYALYPESWYIYDLPGQNVKLALHQITPIIPNNYKDSSLPIGLFNWTIFNENKNQDIELTLMFTWQSGSCSDKFKLDSVKSKSFSNYNNYDTNISGVVISQNIKDMPLEYCISAKKTDNCTITYNCQFYSDDEESGRQLWLDLLDDGNLNNVEYDQNKIPSKKSAKLAIAVAVKVFVKANNQETIDFSLSWNMPEICFNEKPEKLLKRFYTKYFPIENPNAILDISSYGLSQKDNWIRLIREWQMPILNNDLMPKFFKCCLFNELYFLSDGGTVWLNVNDKEDDVNMLDIYREYGRFAYLEGHEYRMYNTYDVHFYASFALLKLWPKLQLSIQYEFCQTIDKVSNQPQKFLFDGKNGIRKEKNTIPHDLGDPEELPLDHINAYNVHDTKDWKDLNLKFILTVYRDYYYLKDLDYLKFMWPHIKSLMITVQSQDHDNDGLIDSEGQPDQTYDAWAVTGASAYCGGLHVACLKCVCEMAKLLNDNDTNDKYSEILIKAKQSYETKLWNGKYYKYDCSNSDYNDSIMTDMCCGHWYLRSSGFKHEVFDQEKIKSCLETIFDFNVIKYGNGKLGSVNGMRPDGSVDITSIQSEEMWIGVTDALASLMIFEGMNDKAWKTLEGMYDLLYNQLGLAFQTPEALIKSSTYRSLGYMRPLCIWSVPFAFDTIKS